jgi:ribonuclease E
MSSNGADTNPGNPPNGDDRRDRRSRDRYGRDRHERNDRAQNDGFNPTAAAAEPTPATAPTGHSMARGAMPKIGSYALPLQDLNALAHQSGLEWVHSKADRVAQVQAAIAAEPRPIHVPRERPPIVVMDEGPLILVETRKDLRQMNMPFDPPAAAS